MIFFMKRQISFTIFACSKYFFFSFKKFQRGKRKHFFLKNLVFQIKEKKKTFFFSLKAFLKETFLRKSIFLKGNF